MFIDEVKRISNDFIVEATMSPKLLEDMASMEKYMSESYSNRIFIELLQNADDALSTKIFVFEHDNNIYFANNGKPFDENDLLSICRSGASNKERGKNIGYRGVGFKSTTQLSNEILIFSNDVCFSFSKQLCSKILNKPQNAIPTVRIPILIDKVSDSILDQVARLNSIGYSTVFVFTKSKIDTFLEELSQVENGHFMFLHNICECNIQIRNLNKLIRIERSNTNKNKQIRILNGNVVEEWLVVSSEKTNIAFKIENNKIVPCKESEAVYHSYLPTMDKMIYPCKVNADFSTDPSRKHLTFDDSTCAAIKDVSLLLFSVISSVINNCGNALYSNVLNIFLSPISFSKINIELDKRLKDLLENTKWIRVCNGDEISVKDYKLFPTDYTPSDTILIREKSYYIQQHSLPLEVYKTINCVDSFLNKYSQSFFTNEEIVSILEDATFIKGINLETHGRLVSNAIKETKKHSIFSADKIDLNKIIMPTKDHGLKQLRDIKKEQLIIDDAATQSMIEYLVPSEIEWFKNTTEISDQLLPIKSTRVEQAKEVSVPSSTTIKPFLTKWRSAEQKCIEIEKTFGNTATDVSVRNEGYDIISITPKGETRYIEVKSVKKDWAFALTNNEYTAASQYTSNYFICLICENTDKIEVKYITNPLSNGVFDKRIKQWEWACFKFTATEFIFDIN